MRTFILDRKLKERGIGVVDLSRMSGVGRSTIDDIRRNNGSGRRRETIEKLAAVLELEYDDLYEDAAALPAGRSAGLDSRDLLDIAERYDAQGNQAMYERYSQLASRIGVNVEALLGKGDALYSAGDEDGARGIYAQVVIALKPRHFPRLKQSLLNFFDLCEKDSNVTPIKAIYDKAKDYCIEDDELFILIGSFFSRTRQPDSLVNECLDIADKLMDREG